MTEERDPERLAAGQQSLIKSLIEDGRKELPSSTQLEALATKLGPVLGGGGGGPGGGGPGAARPGSVAASNAAGMGLATKLGIAALGVVMLGTVMRVVTASESAPIPLAPTSEGPTPAEPAPASSTSPPPDPGTPDPAASPPSAVAPPPLSDSPTPSARPSSWHPLEGGAAPRMPKGAQNMAPELRLLTEAQINLHSDPAKSLALCNDHAKLYPKGDLAQERETVAIAALVALGRTADAQRRADAFKATYPDSPNIRRIETLLSSP